MEPIKFDYPEPVKYIFPLHCFNNSDVVISYEDYKKADGLVIDENNTRILVNNGYTVLGTGESIELDEDKDYVKLFSVIN